MIGPLDTATLARRRIIPFWGRERYDSRIWEQKILPVDRLYSQLVVLPHRISRLDKTEVTKESIGISKDINRHIKGCNTFCQTLHGSNINSSPDILSALQQEGSIVTTYVSSKYYVPFLLGRPSCLRLSLQSGPLSSHFRSLNKGIHMIFPNICERTACKGIRSFGLSHAAYPLPNSMPVDRPLEFRVGK